MEPKIVLKEEEDYIENGVQYDGNHPENQYKKLLFYLGYDSRENAFCCPKHAPLEKVKRSSKLMVSFLIVNCAILLLNGGFFYQMLTNEILMQ